MLRLIMLAGLFLGFSGSAPEQPANADHPPEERLHHATVRRAETRFDVVRLPPRPTGLSLHWKDDNGTPLRTFSALSTHLAENGKTLLFAMNAGIYDKDHAPLGLHVEEGRELRPLVPGAGSGNFFLKPNGVFFVEGGRARVLSTEDYARAARNPDLAVQSGPLLLRHGKVHPSFNPGSSSRYVRNGVGVNTAGAVVFAISREPVCLYDFASLFRDDLQCDDALYLDGAISGWYLRGKEKQPDAFDYAGFFAYTQGAEREQS